METSATPRLEDTEYIEAPPTQVWALISDVTRMAEWSPQVESVRMKALKPAVGARFTNLNSHNGLQWITHGVIVRFDHEREIAFRIDENWVTWSFTLRPTPAGGTVLTQRRETPDGIAEQSRAYTDKYLGGQRAFTEALIAGMRSTLTAIREAATG